MAQFHVFPTFHGADVRGKFLSHFYSQFEKKRITIFKDREIKSGCDISYELVKAIKGSSVSIVLLSNNFASSSWCLDELVEIMKCREDQGQIVIPIFYQVDPSHVRRHSGHFGMTLEKTCEGKSEEKKMEWRNALTKVANIKGEHSQNWLDEVEMIKKVAIDVAKVLNIFSSSKDFEEIPDLLMAIKTEIGSVYVSKKHFYISYKRTTDQGIVKEKSFEFTWCNSIVTSESKQNKSSK